MSYITTDNLTFINAELTNYCNAACPMCARYHIDGVMVKDRVNNMHTTLDFMQEKIGVEIISQLKGFKSCGNFGDASMNPQCLEILGWVRQNNPKAEIVINSNGGARNEEFWRQLAKLDVQVIFGIDGLEDTNHIYRRNVNWQKMMGNVQAFIGEGGKAEWDMLIFKHNEHQIGQCNALADKLGFRSFRYKQSSRWADFDSNGVWKDVDHIFAGGHKLEKSETIKSPDIGSGGNSQKFVTTDGKISSQKINCESYNLEKMQIEIYVAVNGDVSPCCWLGDLKLHEAKNIIDDFKKVNLFHTPLKDILDGNFFQSLEKGIEGVEGARRLQTCYFTCGVRSQ